MCEPAETFESAGARAGAERARAEEASAAALGDRSDFEEVLTTAVAVAAGAVLGAVAVGLGAVLGRLFRPPAPRWKEEEAHGTAVPWMRDPARAAARARQEDRLLMVMHLSGALDDADMT